MKQKETDASVQNHPLQQQYIQLICETRTGRIIDQHLVTQSNIYNIFDTPQLYFSSMT